jgi:hypothetical protein
MAVVTLQQGGRLDIQRLFTAGMRCADICTNGEQVAAVAGKELRVFDLRANSFQNCGTKSVSFLFELMSMLYPSY